MNNIFQRDSVKQIATMNEPVWIQSKTLAFPSLCIFYRFLTSLWCNNKQSSHTFYIFKGGSGWEKEAIIWSSFTISSGSAQAKPHPAISHSAAASYVTTSPTPKI